MQKKYLAENKDYVRIYQKKHRQKNKENLSTVYIKQLLTSKSTLKYSHIPPELIEAKRVHLQIKRYLKEQA